MKNVCRLCHCEPHEVGCGNLGFMRMGEVRLPRLFRAQSRNPVPRNDTSYGKGMSMQLPCRHMKLLEELQTRFPLCRFPWRALGERVGMDERRVMETVEALVNNGVIRRIGPVYDARGCGLRTLLVACEVSPSRVAKALDLISSYPGVTHLYLRRHPVNVWFTCVSRDRDDEKMVLREMQRGISPCRWFELPAKRIFTIGLVVTGDGAGAGARPRHSPQSSTVSGHAVLSKIPFNLPLVRQPFPRGSMGRIRKGKRAGYIRRFGAVVDERRAGYSYTTLVAWEVSSSHLEHAGGTLASSRAVSHCYERVSRDGWPYNLYAVIHARDREKGVAALARLADDTGCGSPLLLETQRRIKRTSLNVPELVRAAQR